MKAPVKSSASSSRVNSIATANRAPRANDRSEGLFAQLAEHHHEQVSLYADPAAGYRGIIAIHNTQLGPALGGTRVWDYESDEAALIDALRDRKSTRLNSSHEWISYAVFCLKKKN